MTFDRIEGLSGGHPGDRKFELMGNRRETDNNTAHGPGNDCAGGPCSMGR